MSAEEMDTGEAVHPEHQGINLELYFLKKG